MARAQAPNTVERGQLTPAAQAVDTFVRPVDNRSPNAALQLADALRDVNPTLQKFLQDEADRQAEQEEAEGERLFKEGDGFDWDKAVKSGSVPAGASPNVKRGYKRSELRNRMYAYGTALRTFYAESNLSELDDEQELQREMQEFTSRWMEENIPTGEYSDLMLKGTAFPIMDRTQAELAQRHVETRIKVVEDGLVENLANEIHTLIDNKIEQGTDDIDLDDLGGFVTAIGADYVSKGVSGAALNEALVDTIVLKARQEGDPEILSLLDKIKTPTGTVGATRYARAKREETENWLASEEVRMEKLGVWRVEQQRKEVVRQAGSVGIQAMLENPFTDLTVMAGRLATVDPDAARTLLSFQDTMQNRAVDVKEYAPEIAVIYDEVANAPDLGSAFQIIMRSANEGAISANTVESLFRFADRNEENKGLYGSRWWRDIEGDLERTIKGSDFNETSTSSFLSRRAKIDLREYAADWRAANAKDDGSVNESAFKDAMERKFDEIVKNPRYGVADDLQNDLSFVDEPAPSTNGAPENDPLNEPSAPDNPYQSDEFRNIVE